MTDSGAVKYCNNNNLNVAHRFHDSDLSIAHNLPDKSDCYLWTVWGSKRGWKLTGFGHTLQEAIDNYNFRNTYTADSLLRELVDMVRHRVWGITQVVHGKVDDFDDVLSRCRTYLEGGKDE